MKWKGFYVIIKKDKGLYPTPSIWGEEKWNNMIERDEMYTDKASC